MTDDETPVELELLGEMANGLAGKLTEGVILLQTGDPMLAAAMGGGAGGATKGLVVAGGRRLVLRRREKLQRAFAAAELESGRTPQELFEHALDQDDERRLDLFVNAFSAAAREADERKVRTFGRLVASGVLAEQDAKVDEDARVFAALASLDRADLRALVHLAETPERGWQRTRYPSKDAGQIDVLDEELPDLAPMLNAILAKLATAGAITDEQGPGLTFGATHWRVTAFGELCVRELLRGEDAGS